MTTLRISANGCILVEGKDVTQLPYDTANALHFVRAMGYTLRNKRIEGFGTMRVWVYDCVMVPENEHAEISGRW